MQPVHLRARWPCTGLNISPAARRCRRLEARVLSVMSSTPQPVTPQEEQLLLLGRRALERKSHIITFPIAGVTFDGRQELVKELQPDQVVLLEREPWNTYDPAAVHVVDLLGRSLGYIPRQHGLNERFTYEGAFGLIASVGLAADSSNYGACVHARPEAASLLLDPMLLTEADAARFADLPAIFGERWAALQATTLAAAQNRCQVTGVRQGQEPLQLVPQWRYNTHKKAAQLTRLVAISQPLAAVKARLEQGVAAVAEQGANEVIAALQELQAAPAGRLYTEINGLADEDTIQYLEFVRRRSNTLQAEKWRIEVLL